MKSRGINKSHPGCGCIGHPAFPAPSGAKKGERFREIPGAPRRGDYQHVDCRAVRCGTLNCHRPA